MQESIKIFKTIPYEARALQGATLLAEYAQEAIEDILADTSVFLKMPTLTDIVKVKSESVYGVYKLVVKMKQGVSYPEYMLNARVVALEPKLVNVVFESEGLEDEEMQESYQSISQESLQTTQSSQATTKPTPNPIPALASELKMSYEEIASELGYEKEVIIASLSSRELDKPLAKAVDLYKENLVLKEALQETQKIKESLKNWVLQS